MKTVFLILLGVLASAWGQGCDNNYGAYLNALKDEVNTDDNKVNALESEFRDDFHTLVRKAFASSSDDASYCYLPDEDLKVDVYGPDGPMKDCQKCQTMTKNLRDKYFKSKDEVRKCLRAHFASAVREELEPCIQGKISNGYNFHVPPIPDFDEKTFSVINIVEEGVDYRIMARSRLDACRSANAAKYQNTKPIFDKGYPGIYAKHCQASKNAKAKAVSSGCSSRFAEVKGASCTCIDEKREDWHQRFAKIYQIVSNAQSASECGQKNQRRRGRVVGKNTNRLGRMYPQGSE